MTQTPTRICVEETINCYCFNPSCSSSIFYPATCIIVKKDLRQVLTGSILCKECKNELISKPVLEMKNVISKSLAPSVRKYKFKYSLEPKM